MERFFIFDKYNTWYDWGLILTAKEVADAEPKTNLVDIDGMDGSLDLSEALMGEVAFSDRTVTATFWTDLGTKQERDSLLRDITAALHGRKVRIIEPDDPEHCLYGRVRITGKVNTLAYAELSIEATCEPWRYALQETERIVPVSGVSDIVIRNEGRRTVCPVVKVTGTVQIIHDGITTSLTDGTYKLTDIRLRHGVNVVGVDGAGSVTFAYTEADL